MRLRRRRYVSQPQRSYFARELIEPVEKFPMARFFRGRLLGGEANCAAGVERGAVHFAQIAETLFMSGGFEFLER